MEKYRDVQKHIASGAYWPMKRLKNLTVLPFITFKTVYLSLTSNKLHSLILTVVVVLLGRVGTEIKGEVSQGSVANMSTVRQLNSKTTNILTSCLLVK